MELTHATIEDVDAVVDCWVALATDQRTHGSRLAVDENREAIADTIARHVVMSELIVARGGSTTAGNDDIVGFVMFTIHRGTYTQTERVGTIVDLFVRPATRNSGVGSDLLAAAETDLVDRGADTLSLEVLAENAAARRFYRRQGYTPHRIELTKSIENDTHSKANE